MKAPRHWPLCGEFTWTGEFPAQRASYAENVSIWWRHHVSCSSQLSFQNHRINHFKIISMLRILLLELIYMCLCVCASCNDIAFSKILTKYNRIWRTYSCYNHVSRVLPHECTSTCHRDQQKLVTKACVLWSNSSTKHSHQCRFSVWFHMPCVCNVIHIVTPHVWRNTHDNYRYIERYCCGRTNLTPIKKPTCYPSHHISNIVIYFAYHWNHLRVSDGSWWPGDRLSIKMSSYQYKDPHVKDKTVSKHSYL